MRSPPWRRRGGWLDGVDEPVLAELRRAWAARGELTDAELPGSRVPDRIIEHVVIDLDATLAEAHSDKATAARHYKGGFGFPPPARSTWATPAWPWRGSCGRATPPRTMPPIMCGCWSLALAQLPCNPRPRQFGRWHRKVDQRAQSRGGGVLDRFPDHRPNRGCHRQGSSCGVAGTLGRERAPGPSPGESQPDAAGASGDPGGGAAAGARRRARSGSSAGSPVRGPGQHVAGGEGELEPRRR